MRVSSIDIHVYHLHFSHYTHIYLSPSPSFSRGMCRRGSVCAWVSRGESWCVWVSRRQRLHGCRGGRVRGCRGEASAWVSREGVCVGVEGRRVRGCRGGGTCAWVSRRHHLACSPSCLLTTHLTSPPRHLTTSPHASRPHHLAISPSRHLLTISPSRHLPTISPSHHLTTCSVSKLINIFCDQTEGYCSILPQNDI